VMDRAEAHASAKGPVREGQMIGNH
jgi:hypothetical protein